jgi:hypothetical protein
MKPERKSPFKQRDTAKRILLLLVPFFLFSVSSSAQKGYDTAPEAVPEEIQVPIFLKILTYDRSLEGRVEDTIHIGVLYFPENELSRKNKDGIIENLRLNKDKTINGVPFSFIEIEFSTNNALDEVAKKKKLNILYITNDAPHMLKGISQITQAKKILTITGRVDYVNQGISVGLGVKEEKPKIVINLSSAKAEGSDFSANLLKVCEVVN